MSPDSVDRPQEAAPQRTPDTEPPAPVAPRRMARVAALVGLGAMVIAMTAAGYALSRAQPDDGECRPRREPIPAQREPGLLYTTAYSGCFAGGMVELYADGRAELHDVHAGAPMASGTAEAAPLRALAERAKALRAYAFGSTCGTSRSAQTLFGTGTRVASAEDRAEIARLAEEAAAPLRAQVAARSAASPR